MSQNSMLNFAVINTAASGLTPIVAANSAERIKVVSYSLVADAPVVVTWQSGATPLTGAMSLIANQSLTAVGSMIEPLFVTAVNAALNVNLGAAIGVRGYLTYYFENF